MMERTTALADLLRQVLERQISEAARTWLEGQLAVWAGGEPGRKFFLAYSAAPRYVGKDPLTVSAAERQEAERLRPGLQIHTWNRDEACRILFLLYLPDRDAATHKQWVEEIFDTADMGEQAALFKALPVFPFPESYALLAAEGVRTNMLTVLEAIVLHNPYPAEVLDETAWNQVYLKAAFTGRPIYQIVGVDRRANATLARIVSDYAHERWAAGRSVSPEIWRVVAPFMTDQHLPDMRRLLESGDPLAVAAARLVCIHATHPQAQELLQAYPEAIQAVPDKLRTWDQIGKVWEQQVAV